MLRGQLHGLRSPKNQFLVGWRWGVPLEALLAPLIFGNKLFGPKRTFGATR